MPPVSQTIRLGVLGILGSGQLARMLAQAAHEMGIPVEILSDTSESPAAQVCQKVTIGSIRDRGALRRFLSNLDQVIFENEFIPCDLIEAAAEGLSVKFTPSLEAMRFLQDKLNQKKALEKLDIPAARYFAAPYPVEDSGQYREWLTKVEAELGPKFVLKWAQLGYDGKGTRTVDLRNGDARRAALVFCDEAILKGVQVYAEEFVPFKRELAIIASHSTDEEFRHYPLVISEQENHVCLRTYGPATALSVKKTLARQAAQAAEALARSIPLHGTFAIEFFETAKGRLLVNEIAPRVHNTGHFTLDASDTSQFENHLRGVLGLPLGSTDSKPAFAMINLLGPAGLRKKLPHPVLPLLRNSVHFHWYGKAEVQPGRKMGHISGSVESPRSLKKLVADLDACKNSWEKELKR